MFRTFSDFFGLLFIFMFGFGLTKKERERRMSMISAIQPTSKAALKMQCLMICKSDVKQAKELYDFYAEDLKDLPDFDVIPPTLMENMKTNAVGIFNFVKENKDDIAQGIDFIRSIISKKNVTPSATPLPPINE